MNDEQVLHSSQFGVSYHLLVAEELSFVYQTFLTHVLLKTQAINFGEF